MSKARFNLAGRPGRGGHRRPAQRLHQPFGAAHLVDGKEAALPGSRVAAGVALRLALQDEVARTILVLHTLMLPSSAAGKDLTDQVPVPRSAALIRDLGLHRPTPGRRQAARRALFLAV